MDASEHDELLALEASLCQALADPSRLRIVEELTRQPRTISELVAALGLSQSTVSRHVALLRERGIVAATREGSSVVCRLADPRAVQIVELLHSMLRDRVRHASALVAPTGPEATR